MAEQRLAAIALAGLYACGAALVLLTAYLPDEPPASAPGMLAVAGIAVVFAIVLFRFAERIRCGAIALMLGWGTTLVTAVAYFTGESPSPLVFFYLWVFLYSAYFFSARVAAAQIVYVAASYGILMALRPPESGWFTWWLIGLGILFVAAALVWTMRRRAEALIAKLFDAARSDPLTGMTNRLGFREHLELELERARRGSTKLAVVAGDLDGFKRVNDRLGHHAGDAALKQVAGVLGETRRAIDTAARTGGEEFTLILPDCDATGAFRAAERHRVAVAADFSSAAEPITISFGFAIYPEDGETAASLLRAADDALYRAKETGRNRTVGYDASHDNAVAHGSQTIGAERFISLALELAESVDLRLSGNARHSETVGRYAEMMAQGLGLSERRVGRIRLAGMLHDIGKAVIPAEILQKDGPLTADEFELVKQHAELGSRLLDHEALQDVREWVASHHERPDGRGYPRGLVGAELALEARIVAVADAYEAMTSDRSYRSSIGHAAAREELRTCTGSQFDPVVVDAFLAALERRFPLDAPKAAPVS